MIYRIELYSDRSTKTGKLRKLANYNLRKLTYWLKHSRFSGGLGELTAAKAAGLCYREDSASLVPHLCPSPRSAHGPSSPALPGAPSSAPAACAAPSGGAPAAAHPWQRWEPSGFRRKSWSRTSRPAGPKGSVKARPGAAERRWQPRAAAPAPSSASRAALPPPPRRSIPSCGAGRTPRASPATRGEHGDGHRRGTAPTPPARGHGSATPRRPHRPAPRSPRRLTGSPPSHTALRAAIAAPGTAMAAPRSPVTARGGPGTAPAEGAPASEGPAPGPAGWAEGSDLSLAFYFLKLVSGSWTVTINQLDCEHRMLG